MKKDKGQFSFVNIGSSLLLTVFLILCLVAFAMLSLSAAKSDYSLSSQLADHKTAYYDASSKAELILGEIDGVLQASAETSGAYYSYIGAITAKLDGAELEGAKISLDMVNGEPIISYEVKAEGKQKLIVEITVTNFANSESYYKIKKWQMLSDEKWEGDNSVKLLPMDN